MKKYELNNQILKTVENQIIDNDPVCARDAFNQLMEMGYSQMQTLEMIGAALVTELNDMIDNGRNFDVAGYSMLLEHVIKEASAKEIVKVKPDEIQKAKDAGYDALMKDDREKMVASWLEGFALLKEVVKKEFPDKAPSLGAMDEKTQFKYNLTTWLEDMERELADSGMQKERIAYCEDMLAMFTWSKEGKDGFLATIGEAYAGMKDVEKCKKWFDEWLEKEPYNTIAVNSYLHCLVDLNELEYGETIVKNHISDDLECDLDTEPLFQHAQAILEKLEKHERANDFKERIAKFHNKCLSLAKAYERDVLPLKNGKGSKRKIYPNDLCPCGSGKKYKQCCGRF